MTAVDVRSATCNKACKQKEDPGKSHTIAMKYLNDSPSEFTTIHLYIARLTVFHRGIKYIAMVCMCSVDMGDILGMDIRQVIVSLTQLLAK